MFEIRHDDDNMVVIANASLHCNDAGLTSAHCTHANKLQQVCYHIINFTSLVVGSPYRRDTAFFNRF